MNVLFECSDLFEVCYMLEVFFASRIVLFDWNVMYFILSYQKKQGLGR